MKKNITINMFGNLYAIDEDACHLLQQYLDSMKRYFQGREGGDEIADDIEHHVAELLWQKKEQGLEAVSIDDVREIISQIGNAQEIDTPDGEQPTPGGDAEDAGSAPEEKASDPQTVSADGSDGRSKFGKKWDEVVRNMRERRLYRDPSDKLLGGVCSGLALYTGIGSALVWRLLFLLAALFGVIFDSCGVLLLLSLSVYFVLFLLLPLPRTPEDRLRQQGSPVTPGNLNQQILNDSAAQQQTEQVQYATYSSGCLWGLLKVLLVIIFLPAVIFLGIVLFFLFVGVAAMLDFGRVLFPIWFQDEMISVQTVLQEHSLLYLFGIVAVLVVVVLPIYGLYRTIRHDGESNRKSHVLMWVTIWVLCLVVSFFAGVSFFMNVNKSVSDFDHNSSGQVWTSGSDSIKEEEPLVDSLGEEVGFPDESVHGDSLAAVHP